MKAVKADGKEQKEFEETFNCDASASGTKKVKTQCKDYKRFSKQEPKQLDRDLRFKIFLARTNLLFKLLETLAWTCGRKL